jgi:hypothetical protein
MVSDQLQAFHRNGIIFEKSSQDNYFDLITARAEQNSELPTFLREGIETDKIFFKEALVWVHIEVGRSQLCLSKAICSSMGR